MSILFGALLIGGSITAFSNIGKSNNNNNNADEKIQIQRLISQLTNSTVPGASALGVENAPITIVEFGDYQCPYCAKFNNETKNDLVNRYVSTGMAKFAFKDLILNDLPQDKLSTLAAEASYCAAEQNKYWEFHDEVYENSKGENTGWVSKESLTGFANAAKVNDINQFSSCLDSHKYNKVVLENDMFAKGLGLVSTPTFLILEKNSSKVAAIEGAQPLSIFENTINQVLNQTI
jgi:protein-disulfide isomerase